ncbi:MAG: hypothetical protein RL319_1095 [Actinomycetota bacterium]|jgi:2Fe-2S ferredoxin
MTDVTFVRADGSSTTLTAQEGLSLMQVAVQNGIPEIIAECGGSLSCATCHVFVEYDPTGELVDSRGAVENEMLECTAVLSKENSRLSCQIKIRTELSGLVVQVPDAQI